MSKSKNPNVIVILLSITSIVALFGNAVVVFLILKKRNWFRKVHSSLLLALAFQDIFTAIGLFALPGFVQSWDVYRLPESPFLGQFYCSVIWSRYVAFALAITSVYTCLMLALDRWVAVFRPMSYRRFSISAKVIAAMLILPWFAGFGFEINSALNVKYVEENNGTRVCKWNKIDTSIRGRTNAVFTFIGMIVLPAVLMILVYSKIVLRRKEQAARVIPQLSDPKRHGSLVPTNVIMLRNPHSSDSAPTSSRNLDSSPSLKRLTCLVCAASAIVVICWLPDQFYYCLFQMGFVELRSELHNWLIILAFLNTCLNPILYCLSDRQYAHEFVTFFNCVYRLDRTKSVVSNVSVSERSSVAERS